MNQTNDGKLEIQRVRDSHTKMTYENVSTASRPGFDEVVVEFLTLCGFQLVSSLKAWVVATSRVSLQTSFAEVVRNATKSQHL